MAQIGLSNYNVNNCIKIDNKRISIGEIRSVSAIMDYGLYLNAHIYKRERGMTEQSSYLENKKRKNILRHPEENLGNVLNSQLLTDLKSYVFSHELYTTDTGENTPTYNFCQNTQNRPNRKPHCQPMFSHYRKGVSAGGYFWYQKSKELLCLQKEFQKCDEYRHRLREP